MASALEIQEHNQRVSNLRTALQLAYVGPAKPGELRKLGDAINAEFDRCAELGCFVTPDSAEARKR